MLSLAVVLQLVPYLYVFAALLKLAVRPSDTGGVYRKPVLILSGISGLLTTSLGISLQYFPPQLVTSLRTYELEMILGTLFFIGLAAYFFFIYGRHRVPAEIAVGTAALTTGDSPVPVSEAHR
jgi:amino acid transporter